MTNLKKLKIDYGRIKNIFHQLQAIIELKANLTVEAKNKSSIKFCQKFFLKIYIILRDNGKMFH